MVRISSKLNLFIESRFRQNILVYRLIPRQHEKLTNQKFVDLTILNILNSLQKYII